VIEVQPKENRMPRTKVIPASQLKVREIDCEHCGTSVRVINPDVTSVICSLCVCKRIAFPTPKPDPKAKKQKTPTLPKKTKTQPKTQTKTQAKTSPVRKGKRGRKPGVGKVIVDYINKHGEADFDVLSKVYAKEMKKQGKEKTAAQVKNNLNALLYVLSKDGKIDYC
jgi:hypothetical protein